MEWNESNTSRERETNKNRCLPQIAFVGGILDVVADVVVHSMGGGAVSGIKDLVSKYRFRTRYTNIRDLPTRCFKFKDPLQ